MGAVWPGTTRRFTYAGLDALPEPLKIGALNVIEASAWSSELSGALGAGSLFAAIALTGKSMDAKKDALQRATEYNARHR